MSTHRIPPELLGPEAERLLMRDVDALRGALGRLDSDAWHLPTPCRGAAVGIVVEHLAEGAEHFTAALRERDRSDRPLFEGSDLEGVPGLPAELAPREPVTQRYERSHAQLLHALSLLRIEDWSWPAFSPLGGAETVAETVRRFVSHHYVHRHDVLTAVHRLPDRHDGVLRLVCESVLDTLARLGGEVIGPPMTFEVAVSAPGTAAWTLRFEDPESLGADDIEPWRELLEWRPATPSAHRVERGAPDAPRAIVWTTPEQLWRAAFGRGASWDELDVHGDDEGRAAWRRLVEAAGQRAGEAIHIAR